MSFIRAFLSRLRDSLVSPSTPNLTTMTTSTFFPTVAGVRVTFPTLPLSPGQLHTFTSRSLEARVFTHRSAAIMTTTYADFSHAAGGTRNGRWRDDNEHLEFIGDMVLKGLTGMLIEDLHPDADEGYMSVWPPAFRPPLVPRS